MKIFQAKKISTLTSEAIKMDNETRETIEFKAEMDMDEYLCLLGEIAYNDEQYCNNALGTV